jgi:O-antigen ligase
MESQSKTVCRGSGFRDTETCSPASRQARVAWGLILLWLGLQLFNYAEAMRWLAPEVFGLSMSPDRIIFMMLCALLVLNRLNQQSRFSNRPEGIMLAFAALCIVSWHLAGSDTERNRWLVTIFQLSVFPFCAYLLIRLLPFDSTRAGQLQAVFMAMAFYFAITGIAQHYKVAWLVWPSYILDPSIGLTPDRARGPLLNTADQGWVLLGGAALACMKIPRAHGLAKLLLASLLGICSLATYFTYTRGSWLAFALGLSIAAWLRRRDGGMRIVFALLGVLLLLTLTGFASHLSFYEPTLFSRRQNTVEYRKGAMAVAWDVFKTSPVVGVGYGTFGNNLEQYESTGSLNLDDGNHNLYLGLAAELGIVGLSLYLGIFALILRQLFSLWKHASDEPVVADLIALSFAMTASFFVLSQFGDWRFHLLPHNYLFVTFGMAAAAARCSAPLNTTVTTARATVPPSRLGHTRTVSSPRPPRER